MIGRLDAAARRPEIGAAILGLAHGVRLRRDGRKLHLLGRVERRVRAHENPERFLGADEIDERARELRVVGRKLLRGADDVEAIPGPGLEPRPGVLEVLPQHRHVSARRGDGDLPADVGGGEPRDIHLLGGVGPVDPALGSDDGKGQLDVPGQALAGLQHVGPLRSCRIEERRDPVAGDGGQGEGAHLAQERMGPLDLGDRDSDAGVPRKCPAHRLLEGDARGRGLGMCRERHGREQQGEDAGSGISCDHVSPMRQRLTSNERGR